MGTRNIISYDVEEPYGACWQRHIDETVISGKIPGIDFSTMVTHRLGKFAAAGKPPVATSID